MAANTSRNDAPSPVDQELSEIVGNSPAVEKLAVPAAFRVSAVPEGPRVVVFGSIHGDEPAGYCAIAELLRRFAAGDLQLLRGSLIMAAGNELALEQKVRQVERNLNRLFKKEPITAPTCYEEERVESLKGLLTGADYMMDLHATSQPTPPFIMCESHLISEAREMGFARIVTGWNELGDATLSGDTETYFNSVGGKGFTVECGQRDAAEGPAAGIDAVRRLLRHVGLLHYHAPPEAKPAVYKLVTSVKVDKKAFRYVQQFSSFHQLQRGDEIGREGDKLLRAPDECVLIMPSTSEYMLAHAGSE
jgi:succinylglutamate desuccinylase